MHTSNGGYNWEVQLVDTVGDFQVITFIDKKHGWAGGQTSGIWYTTNGGKSWTGGSVVVPWYVLSITFLDSLRGWADGTAMPLLYTTDGGRMWTPHPIVTNSRKIFFADSLHGWILSGTRGGIWRTLDGGKNWVFNSEPNLNAGNFIDIFFVDSLTGYITHESGTYGSNDGGISWQKRSSEAAHDLFFTRKDFGWGVNISERGLNLRNLVHTSDSGKTWLSDPRTVTNKTLLGVDFINAKIGWAAGNSGLILHTKDGGATWLQQISGTGSRLGDVFFLNDKQGWCVGVSGTILQTSDGGITWQKQQSNTEFGFSAVTFTDSLSGWVVGGGVSQNAIVGIILRTKDGGKRWNDITPGLIPTLDDVVFVDTLKGWVAAGGGSALDAGAILHTADGGDHWTFQILDYNSAFQSIAFVDSLTGWTAGYYQNQAAILSTSDGGKHWQVHKNGLFWAIAFVDKLNGWGAASGGIYRTTDGGNTWLEQDHLTSRTFSAIDFVDRFNGWAVGDLGMIVRTTNGGVTFVERTPEITDIPADFILYPNYPNPFNPATQIRFDLYRSNTYVQLVIFDILGREVVKLVDQRLSVGQHQAIWNGKDAKGGKMPSGIYFYRLSSERFVQTKKMILFQ